MTQKEFQSRFNQSELDTALLYRTVDRSRPQKLPEIAKSPGRKIPFSVGANRDAGMRAPQTYSPARSMNPNDVRQLMLTRRAAASPDARQNTQAAPRAEHPFCNYEPQLTQYEPAAVDFAARYEGLHAELEAHDVERERFYGKAGGFSQNAAQ